MECNTIRADSRALRRTVDTGALRAQEVAFCQDLSDLRLDPFGLSRLGLRCLNVENAQ
jgi:hypothetical protein